MRVTLFCPLVSPGEITLKFVLLFLCQLFAMERGVYRVLLCSTVDIKGSIKLPLLIGKLEIEILKGKSKMLSPLPSKSLLHSLHEQTVFRETVSDLPNAESTSLQCAHGKVTKTSVYFVVVPCSARRLNFELPTFLLSESSAFKKYMVLPTPFPDLILPKKKKSLSLISCTAECFK